MQTKHPAEASKLCYRPIVTAWYRNQARNQRGENHP